jgi:hypothetical protein
MDRSLNTDLLADELGSDSPRRAATSSTTALFAPPAEEPRSSTTDATQDRPNTGDRRQPRDDRRNSDDRRSRSLRRGRDRQRDSSAKQIAYLGTVLCALSVGLSIYAFMKAPITFTPSPACADGFGGQRIEHRGLSSLWAVVMVLAAAGLVIPDRKRRPVVLMILCGVSVGLFVGAYFTVGSKFDGLCLV